MFVCLKLINIVTGDVCIGTYYIGTYVAMHVEVQLTSGNSSAVWRFVFNWKLTAIVKYQIHYITLGLKKLGSIHSITALLLPKQRN